MLPIAISIAPSLWHQVTVARMSLAIFSPLLADGTKPSPSSDRGAERAAVFYSLIGSAKLIGTILKRICAPYVPASPITPINRIEELLPWHVAPSLETASPVSRIDTAQWWKAVLDFPTYLLSMHWRMSRQLL